VVVALSLPVLDGDVLPPSGGLVVVALSLTGLQVLVWDGMDPPMLVEAVIVWSSSNVVSVPCDGPVLSHVSGQIDIS